MKHAGALTVKIPEELAARIEAILPRSGHATLEEFVTASILEMLTSLEARERADL